RCASVAILGERNETQEPLEERMSGYICVYNFSINHLCDVVSSFFGKIFAKNSLKTKKSHLGNCLHVGFVSCLWTLRALIDLQTRVFFKKMSSSTPSGRLTAGGPSLTIGQPSDSRVPFAIKLLIGLFGVLLTAF